MDLTGCAIADLRRTVCTSTLSPSRSIYAAPPPASPETRALNARSRPARRRTPRSLRLTPQPVQPPGPPTRVLQRSHECGERPRAAHLEDQLTKFEEHLRLAGSPSRLPAPERAKASAMPANNRRWLDDRKGIQNTRRDPI